MKLIAQSQQPVTPVPYLHLGYLSAAQLNPHAAPLLISWLGLCVVLVVFWQRVEWLKFVGTLVLLASLIAIIKYLGAHPTTAP